MISPRASSCWPLRSSSADPTSCAPRWRMTRRRTPTARASSTRYSASTPRRAQADSRGARHEPLVERGRPRRRHRGAGHPGARRVRAEGRSRSTTSCSSSAWPSTSDSELELALGSKLGGVDGKISLVDALLSGKASDADHRDPEGTARPAARAPHRGTHPLRGHHRRRRGRQRHRHRHRRDRARRRAAQAARRRPSSKQYGRDIRINEIVDPVILGGMRVQVGSEVIDGTISNRIADLRLRLAS